MPDKYQLIQKSKRVWQLCRLELHKSGDLDILIAIPFGDSFHRLAAAVAELKILRDGQSYFST
jgi:hypothetical protein